MPLSSLVFVSFTCVSLHTSTPTARIPGPGLRESSSLVGEKGLDGLAVAMLLFRERLEPLTELFLPFAGPNQAVESLSVSELSKLVKSQGTERFREQLIVQAVERLGVRSLHFQEMNAVNALIGCLDDERVAIRIAALGQMISLSRSNCLGCNRLIISQKILARLGHGDASCAIWSCLVLGDIPEAGADATPIMLRIIEDPKTDDLLKKSCLLVLERIGSRLKLPPKIIVGLTTASDDEIACGSLAALGRICPDNCKTLEILNIAFLDERFFRRLQAANCLCRLGHFQVDQEASFCRHLYDIDELHRFCTAKVYAKYALGPRNRRWELLALCLLDPSPRIRQELAKALVCEFCTELICHRGIVSHP